MFLHVFQCSTCFSDRPRGRVLSSAQRSAEWPRRPARPCPRTPPGEPQSPDFPESLSAPFSFPRRCPAALDHGRRLQRLTMRRAAPPPSMTRHQTLVSRTRSEASHRVSATAVPPPVVQLCLLPPLPTRGSRPKVPPRWRQTPHLVNLRRSEEHTSELQSLRHLV